MRLQHLNYFNNIRMYIFASQSEYSEHSESQGSPVSDGWEAGSTHNVIIMLLCSVLFLKIAKEMLPSLGSHLFLNSYYVNFKLVFLC